MNDAAAKAIAAATIAEVEVIARQWADEFVATRKARVARKKLRYTGRLHDSIKYEMKRNSGPKWVIRIQYAYYGKFHDKGVKRPMPKGGRKYVERITDWVKARGLANFTTRRTGTTDQVARDVAWAIIKGNANKTPWERRKWLNPMAGDITDLGNRIEKLLPEAIVQDVVKVLES
jgi:hypothetical protein